ncbi:hypothetical protein GGF32_003811 [Allomyces javanicus]|nr:hypothetical protein GGF32_003811 [Allomyces javanicus]
MFKHLYRLNTSRRDRFVRVYDLPADADAFNRLGMDVPVTEVDHDLYTLDSADGLTSNNEPVPVTVRVDVLDLGTYYLDDHTVAMGGIPVREYLQDRDLDHHYYDLLDSIRAVCRDVFPVFDCPGSYTVVFQVDKCLQTVRIANLVCTITAFAKRCADAFTGFLDDLGKVSLVEALSRQSRYYYLAFVVVFTVLLYESVAIR